MVGMLVIANRFGKVYSDCPREVRFCYLFFFLHMVSELAVSDSQVDLHTAICEGLVVGKP
jgi:hypothetical protein